MSKVFSTPKMPEPKPAAPLPSETDARKARSRRTSRAAQAGGKESTLLSTGGRETLGA